MNNSHTELKKLPRHQTDEEAEKFLETADLSEYDLSEFTTVRFVFKSDGSDDEDFALHLPKPVARALETAATEAGVSQDDLVRKFIGDGLAAMEKANADA